MVPAKMSSHTASALEKKEAASADENAKIAWRYNEMNMNSSKIQNLSSEIPPLDLSKNEEDKSKTKGRVTLRDLSDIRNLKELYIDICSAYQECLKDPNDTSVKRFLITNLFHDLTHFKFDSVELNRFIRALKTLFLSSHCICLFTIPPNICPKIKNAMMLSFELVMRIEEIIENKHFEDFEAILHFLKTPGQNSLVPVRLETLSWGVKMNLRKKVIIEKLYLSPEKDVQPGVSLDDEKKPGKSQGSLCSSKPSAKKDFEF